MKLYDTLSSYFQQAGIDSLNLEDLLSTTFIVIDDLYKQFVPKRILSDADQRVASRTAKC